MKTGFTLFILAVLFLAFDFSNAHAQTNWTKHVGNPVLSPITPSNWEDWAVYTPFVLKHGDTLKMWYTGSKSFGVQQIGYATSIDGISWQRYAQNPVLNVGALGSWDDEYVGYPKIILVDTTYHMWYAGSNDLNNLIFRIGYATSYNGINWTKHPNPVLPLGNPGEWDSATHAGHSFFFDGDSFRVWYVGSDNLTTRRYKIGYAKSYDGITWEKYPENPVFYGAGSWDSLKIHGPCVIVDSSGYQMWYQGRLGSNYRIGYATSLDGINWVALDTFVLDIGNPGKWDDYGVGAHHVLFDDTTYKMWYSGWRANTGTRIGYATALDPNSINNNDHKNITKGFVLSQNYPNPFNPSTSIEFSIPKTEFVTLKIYNLLGQEVAKLVSDKLAQGSYNYTWDASGFASGVYMFKIEAGGFIQTRKLILMK